MRHRFLRPTPLALAALAVLVTACGDEVTDPDALLESAEAEAVMRSAAALPSLGELMDAAVAAEPSQEAALVRARELWDAGVAVQDSRSSARRRLAARYAAPVLADALEPGAWNALRDRAEGWMGTARTMLQHLEVPTVEARLDAARSYLERSDGAQTDRTRAYYLILASSELVETTPRFVARSLAEEAASAVERARSRAEGGPSPQSLERAERLKDWSARAVEEGEYLLAIQRAYYAIQLSEGR